MTTLFNPYKVGDKFTSDSYNSKIDDLKSSLGTNEDVRFVGYFEVASPATTITLPYVCRTLLITITVPNGFGDFLLNTRINNDSGNNYFLRAASLVTLNQIQGVYGANLIVNTVLDNANTGFHIFVIKSARKGFSSNIYSHDQFIHLDSNPVTSLRFSHNQLQPIYVSIRALV
jgi:hypothetical protein